VTLWFSLKKIKQSLVSPKDGVCNKWHEYIIDGKIVRITYPVNHPVYYNILLLYKTKSAPPQGRCCGYACFATPAKVSLTTAIALTFIHTLTHITNITAVSMRMWDTNCSPLQSIKQDEGCRKFIFAATRASYNLLAASEGGKEGHAIQLLEVRVCT